MLFGYIATFKTTQNKSLHPNGVQFAVMPVIYGEKCEDVFLSDEKMFNLDEQNGFRYYWHDLWNEKAIFSK